MKKSFLLVFAAAGMLAACNSGESDTRVSGLEQRVSALEQNHNHAASTQPVATNVSQEQSEFYQDETPKVEGPTAKIQYQGMEHDFGTIKEGAIVQHTFKFTNTGDVPLIIQSAQAACGCTVPKKPEKPIAPGQTGEIEVRFDSATRTGNQNKTVTVTANTDPAITRLTIKGTVEPKAATAATTTEGPVRN